MQDISEYERGIHTTGQAARRLKRCCSVFGVRVGYRTLTSFEAGVVFVLALQTNNMITAALNEEAFNLTQFSVIMFLILISIIFSYSKEQFVAEYGESLSKTEHSDSNVPRSFAHAFNQ